MGETCEIDAWFGLVVAVVLRLGEQATTPHDIMDEDPSASGTKRRKTVPGVTSNNDDTTVDLQQMLQQNLAQMGRMEQLMNRMESKLSRMGQLESKCEELEARCSSLESSLHQPVNSIQGSVHSIDSKLDTLQQSIKPIEATSAQLSSMVGKIESNLDKKIEATTKSLTSKVESVAKYVAMLFKNQSWHYSPRVHSTDYLIDHGVGEDSDVTEYFFEKMKKATIEMRQGGCEAIYDGVHDGKRGILLEGRPDDGISLSHDEIFMPNWLEFTHTLAQYDITLNVIPDDTITTFELIHVEISDEVVPHLLHGLERTHFKSFTFSNNSFGRHGIPMVRYILERNPHLKELELFGNPIEREEAEILCRRFQNHPSLEQLTLNGCCNGYGFHMLCSVLGSCDELTSLNMSVNDISTGGSTFLPDFISTNICLTVLNLNGNNLNDHDAVLIADALKRNNTLRELYLGDNGITESGQDAFWKAVYDTTSLNAAAKSNHICQIILSHYSRGKTYYSNDSEDPDINRRRKLYNILAGRNREMSNVQHFGDLTHKHLPEVLTLVQSSGGTRPRCHPRLQAHSVQTTYQYGANVSPLSIIYDLMRKWDEAFALYESCGRSAESKKTELRAEDQQ